MFHMKFTEDQLLYIGAQTRRENNTTVFAEDFTLLVWPGWPRGSSQSSNVEN